MLLPRPARDIGPAVDQILHNHFTIIRIQSTDYLVATSRLQRTSWPHHIGTRRERSAQFHVQLLVRALAEFLPGLRAGISCRSAGGAEGSDLPCGRRVRGAGGKHAGQRAFGEAERARQRAFDGRASRLRSGRGGGVRTEVLAKGCFSSSSSSGKFTIP